MRGHVHTYSGAISHVTVFHPQVSLDVHACRLCSIPSPGLTVTLATTRLPTAQCQACQPGAGCQGLNDGTAPSADLAPGGWRVTDQLCARRKRERTLRAVVCVSMQRKVGTSVRGRGGGVGAWSRGVCACGAHLQSVHHLRSHAHPVDTGEQKYA